MVLLEEPDTNVKLFVNSAHHHQGSSHANTSTLTKSTMQDLVDLTRVYQSDHEKSCISIVRPPIIRFLVGAKRIY